MIMTPERNTRPTITDELISVVVNTIRDRFQPERIIVFGSAARGQAGPDSDLDLFVVLKADSPAYKRPGIIRLALPRTISMDIVVFTPEEVAYWNGAVGHIVTEVLKTGKVMYDKSA